MKPKLSILYAILMAIISPTLLYAQENYTPDQKEVLSVIEELFDAYRAADADRAQVLFYEGAIMQRVQVKEGKTIATEPGPAQKWVDYIGSGLDKLHDEPIWDSVVQIDGGLANVWTKYAFYLDGKFSHCGVDSFTLVKDGDAWKIFHIVDTGRKDNCNIPESVRKKHEKS